MSSVFKQHVRLYEGIAMQAMLVLSFSLILSLVFRGILW